MPHRRPAAAAASPQAALHAAAAAAAAAAAPKKHVLLDTDDRQAAPAPSAPALPCGSEADEPALCRLCWGEGQTADGVLQDSCADPLISPCACAGSLKWIHRQCLQDWQRTLRAQGQGRRAHICELCKTPYQLDGAGSSRSSGDRSSSSSSRPLHWRVLAGVNAGLFDAVHHAPWHSLAVQLWHGYVMAHGAVQALRSGVSGFGAGLSLGQVLIKEQACLLNGLLTYTSGMLGSPYAEMVWCQAFGALFVGMLSELVYTSVLGALGGMAFGFCTGYVGAIKGSVRFMSHSSCRVLAAASVVASRVVRRALRLLLRVR